MWYNVCLSSLVLSFWANFFCFFVFLCQGKYTLMWYWEFTAGSYYTTCFEVEITGNFGYTGNDDDDTTESTSFDDYIIQIPIQYFGALYDEDTLATGANNIELDDDSISFNFVVVSESGGDTGNLMYGALCFFAIAFCKFCFVIIFIVNVISFFFVFLFFVCV